MSLPFKPRILILPLAAVVIGLLVWFKTSQAPQEISPDERAGLLRRRPATTFKLHDLASQPFTLSRYLGRHKLLVVFFESKEGVANNPQLQSLKAGIDKLTAHGEKVIAISNSTPYANRESVKKASDYVAGDRGEVDYFPFHVLSDADLSVANQWGALTRDEPPVVNPSAFVVDRAGVISWSEVGLKEPLSVERLAEELQRAR